MVRSTEMRCVVFCHKAGWPSNWVATMKTLLFMFVFQASVLAFTLPAQAPTELFDHDHPVWDELLAGHVHAGGMVDYRGLAKQRGRLDPYLESLQAVTAKEYATWENKEREAFWINAYNAYTVLLILDNYPVESIRDLGGFFSPVWKKRFIPLQHLAPGHKKTLSLDEVEHGILAGTARQPLFHFAIVCASASCPELRPEAYTAAKLDGQLAEAGRGFLADKSKNAARVRDGKLRISKIFDWSKGELKAFPGGIRGLLLEYGPQEMLITLKDANVPLAYLDYDWSINEWIPPRKER
ncbi:MAG: hypothetical protein CMK00_04835 [Planctomycetes bacterium]|nr:hypothetical protein [Planctomycetota bacterium]